MKIFFLTLALMIGTFPSFAGNSSADSLKELGSVTYDKSGDNYIKVSVLENVELKKTYLKFYQCHYDNCFNIGTPNEENGYELESLLEKDFFNNPQKDYLNYENLSKTGNGMAIGASIGTLGILAGALVIATVPVGTLTGGIVGAIIDIKRYFNRECLLKELVQGSKYKIKNFDELVLRIEEELI